MSFEGYFEIQGITHIQNHSSMRKNFTAQKLQI